MMQRVIDVDAHFEPGDTWLADYPKLAARLPAFNVGHSAAKSLLGEMLRDVPADQRPSWDDLAPPGVKTMFGREKADEEKRRREFAGYEQMPVANARARLKWMDSQGIDIQHPICLTGLAFSGAVEDTPLRRELIETCNTWLADVCAEGDGRLFPVSVIDFTDIDVAIAELTRMRRRGSRIFLIPAQPVNGISPAHPSWDRLWSAAVDLGMVAMHHIGLGNMRFDPGWANVGGDATLLRQIGGSHYHVPAMTLLYSMVYSGLFARHPKLTVLLAEVGVGWLPFLYWDIDHVCSQHAGLMLGAWRYPLKPSEYLARNVRATPLRGVVGGGDQELTTIMAQLPDDMLVFSSDFPHFEGHLAPAAHYRTQLAGFSQARRDTFYGGSMAAAYARMGDPIR
jgi:predicted TIM-barrel fold metal-dependent hydrolase